MEVGRYIDGRTITWEQATCCFEVGGTQVSIARMREYDYHGQVEWLSKEIAKWARALAPVDIVVPASIPNQAGVASPARWPSGINRSGTWCPICGNRDSHKTTSGLGCVFWIFVLVSMGIALIMIPFLPRTWHCHVCGNAWRA